MQHPIAYRATLAKLQQHRMLGEAYCYYQTHHCFDLFQGDIKILKAHAARARQESLRHAQALLDLNKSLSKAMPVIHFKGVTLSHLLYHDAALRTCHDIDLLIPQDKRLLADSVMKALGYQRRVPSENIKANEQQYLARHYKDWSYFHPEKQIIVEVHSRLHAAPSLSSVPMTMIWQQARCYEFCQQPLKVIDPDYYFYYLLVHGAISVYKRLHWLSDVVAFVNTQKIDWCRLLDLCAQDKTEALLLFSFQLAEEFFNLPMPEPIVSLAKQVKLQKHSSQLKALRIKFMRAQDNNQPLSSYIREKQFLLYVKKTWRYKLDWYYYYFSITRALPYVKLPTKLYWLYQLIKPFFFLLFVIEKITGKEGRSSEN